MPNIPLTRVELNPTGEVEEQAFSNQLTLLLNDALAWHSFLSPSVCLRQQKTVSLSCHGGEPVVRITVNQTVSAEKSGSEPLLALIAQAVEDRFPKLDA